MRPLRLWHSVGPPTRKRSGTLVFIAVMGALLIGGTAMAANLGLLTSTAPRDRGYRLEVPRPALSVTLPTTEPSPPTVESTSVSESDEGADADLDDADDSPTTEGPKADDFEDADDESGDDDESESDDDAADDDDDDDRDDDAESTSQSEGPDRDTDRSESEAPGGKTGGVRLGADGSLDDD